MESEAESKGGDDMTSLRLKEIRQQLETRIRTRHKEQQELISSLQTLVPDLVSSLNLSLRLLSTFHRRPFSPLSPPPSSSSSPRPHPKPKPHLPPPPLLPHSKPTPDSTHPLADSLSLLRSMLAACLLDRLPFTPIDSSTVLRKIENDHTVTLPEKAALRDAGGEAGAIFAVETGLRSMAEDNGGLELEEFVVSGKSRVMVMSIDPARLLRELPHNANSTSSAPEGLFGMPPLFPGGPIMGPRGIMGMPRGMPGQLRPPFGPNVGAVKPKTEEDMIKDVEALLSKKSFKELQKSKTGEELLDLIHRPTAKEAAVAAKFKSKNGSQLKEYCTALTKEDCRLKSGSFIACEKVHFRRIIALHTDINLGDCSFLDTCRHMKTCKYVHYELDPIQDASPMMMGNVAPQKSLKMQRAEYCSEVELGEPQWINCDIRNFRMDILGQFGVIMADPPWDIHMELPYGTMADDEMRTLNVPALQTDGMIFLWVTGRAMELGRECLELWGYKRVEEIIWVKTNQLQRIIRTGRTGHWLNHSKEHCLVGIKGNPLVNRNIDTDVIVAEVRETSRKPDEMYPLLERISPRTRKLELFARMHNTQAGWLSLGNQLSGARLVDEGLRARFKAAYPDVEVQPPSPPRRSAMEVDPSAPEVRTPFSGIESKLTTPQVIPPGVSEAACVPEEKPLGSQDVEMVS